MTKMTTFDDIKKALWAGANTFRDNIDASNYKDYVLSMFFVKYLSDTYKESVEELEKEYSGIRLERQIENLPFSLKKEHTFDYLLDNKFAMNAEDVLAACDTHTKVIWICTPNNPSGNDICRSEIEHILNTFQGIVVIDEAYSDFSQQKTFRTELSTYPNMIVLNTMSKAWGCAGIRLGMAFASPEIIGIFNKVKYPYNVNCLTQEKAAAILDNIQEVQIWVAQILEEKARVIEAFGQLDVCVKIYPSAANFFLVEVTDAQSIYDYLVNKGIIVRNRSQIALCKNCLRITIGNRTENNELLAALRVYK